MGRVGSCFDNAAAEAFFSSLEWEVLSRHQLTDANHARSVVLPWCYEFYNHRRRHSSAQMLSPVAYENLTADQPVPAQGKSSTIRGEPQYHSVTTTAWPLPASRGTPGLPARAA